MDDLRTRIAAVVAAHRDQCGDCSCGWESWEESWDMHLADVLIRELGLRRDPIALQVAALLFGDFRAERHRYVTEWIAE